MVVKNGMRLAQCLVGFRLAVEGGMEAAVSPGWEHWELRLVSQAGSPMGPQHWAQLAMVPCLPEQPCSSSGTPVEHPCPVGTELWVPHSYKPWLQRAGVCHCSLSVSASLSSSMGCLSHHWR